MTASATEARPGPAAPTAAESLTPDARGAWHRLRGWLIAIGGLLAAALVSILTVASIGSVSDRLLDPSSPAPSGAKALFEVLGQRGVDTQQVTSLGDLESALGGAGSTTVVLDDASFILNETQLDDIAAGAYGDIDRLVLLNPAGSAFDLATSVSTYAGQFASPNDDPDAAATFEAGSACALGERAPAITNEGGHEFEPIGDAVGCYQVRDGYAVVIGVDRGVEIVVLGASMNLTNEVITEEANAAMAINLLGAHERLVWYLPSAEDSLSDAPSFRDYVPPWLTPVIILLIAAGVACVIWRGRRFGPLVAERLPVTVPAAETIEGRARLYDHGDARLHALDSIRLGTITRLAELLGLGRGASTEAVIEATAQTAGVTREHAYRVLLVGYPDTDAALVELANAAAELERRVRAATGRAETSRRPDPKEHPNR